MRLTTRSAPRPIASRRPRRGRLLALLIALAASEGPARRALSDETTDALVAAHDGGDEGAWTAAVGALRTSPWFLADDLVALGRADVAVHLAGSAQTPDQAALLAWTNHPPATYPAARAALALAIERTREKDPDGVVKALAGVVAAEGSVLEARIAITLAPALHRRGDLRAALDAFRRAAASGRRLGWLQLEEMALRGVDRSGSPLNAFVEVTEALRRRIELLEALGDPVGAAVARGDLAGWAMRSGDYATSIADLQRAYAVLSKHGATDAQTVVALNAGLVLARRGEFAAAEDWLDRAGAPDGTAANGKVDLRLVTLRAAVQSELGYHDAAIGDLRKALERLATSSSPDRATLLDVLGNIERENGALAEAQKTLAQAEAEWTRIGDPWGVAFARRSVAKVLRARGQWTEALRTLEDIPRDSADDPYESGLAALERGRCLVGLARHGEALEALDRAMTVFETTGALELKAEVDLARAQVFAATGDQERSWTHAVRALDEIDDATAGLADESLARARATHAEMAEAAFRAAAAAGRGDWMVTALERWRARALLDALGGRLRLGATGLPEDLALAAEAARARYSVAQDARTNALFSHDRAARIAAATELRAAAAAWSTARGRIQKAAKGAATLANPAPLAADAVQRSLADDEAIVYVVRVEDRVLGVVVSKAGSEFRSLGTAAESADVLGTLEVIQGIPIQPALEALEKVRRVVSQALRVPEAAKTLCICPEGEWSYAPWAAIFPDRRVCLIPSATARAALLELPRRGGSGVLAIGSPEYGRPDPDSVPLYFRAMKLTPLPDALLEMDDVTLDGDPVITGPRATEAGLRSALASRPRWLAVHFACHGLIDDRSPSTSALALSPDAADDGFLSALDILAMEFPVDLVVASACSTARGTLVSGEGVMGLTRAFMIAGAPRVVASLWDVDDPATRAMMRTFYERLRAGADTATALRGAMLAVRDDPAHPEWRHPRAWAGWVLWGRPD